MVVTIIRNYLDSKYFQAYITYTHKQPNQLKEINYAY